ncbi:undecaprenyldiphospho-muramoylpentapeptide beta-N-acetylglucosaminyltransferase [Arthrobacter agilis]|uniref:undecaprenyldiphospho-muramoylpentapeptide beta-N-acetylglucosaminyltransferase n=1 Tax=Arthrobacter agilis TaxID=37921 RepID=UPI000B35A2DA|nr:undecaprenyldiphospho-muramoylpentapeptide beta-N-acetylglucosaminyltransferase [Arthrobacter agilis]OUM45392.1 undecaprenyldiphospho-muramoylpentapeptide beta-N-acetylglucosaminyltransferase [Arthrobacter agilis]PPB46980.1 undecaprenyldiphospho-muramoylpentapeptide beta-N-acetylglucosaminyltransferase [Arthrobacter agilis]TPV23425.1 undecaprenyldiphospho-muramoylpentapeptide beta-N-acetylglucosaminyltransferase [Arthrobacter agilis]VDR31807.1 UDP-N-acetylglucosamine--N-acetylmuramyl-(pentap
MADPAASEASAAQPGALSVVLAGGGTAGHISPLLAIAGAVVAQRPGTRITAVGTEAGMETRLVPAAGFDLRTIDRVPLPRRPSVDLLKLPVRLVRAVRQARAIIVDTGADVVVGVGGYVSTPVYLAAWIRRVPVVIHEANARPGIANRVGARIAARVAVAFEGTGLTDAVLVGMPMRRSIADLDRSADSSGARASLGLDPDRPTLIVTGGSSGAASLNRAIAASVPDLIAAGIQVLHITGRGKRIDGDDGARFTAAGYHQVEFVDGMERVYAAADLLVARAGAATVSEVSAVGLPSVLVPLPHGNGEQRLNAASLVAAGGALLVEDAAVTPSWIRESVVPLVADAERLGAMSKAAYSQGVRDADRRMAELVLTVAGESR